MKVICAYCNKNMGTKPGKGTSHGICPKCFDAEMAKMEKDGFGKVEK